MKRPTKIVLGVVAALVVLVIVGLVVVVTRIDGIVHRTVESEGTAQLDVATTLQSADVSIFGQSLTLDGLTIANPEGYTSPNLFELGQVNVGVGYAGLTSDPVRISQITVNSPRLVIERGGDGGLAEQLRVNLRDLLANLDTEGETTKLIIDELTVSNTEVVIRPNIEGLDEQYAVTIPDVTLNNVGTGEGAGNGVAIGRVVADLAVALGRQALADEDLPPELRAVLAGDLQEVLSEYGDKLKTEVRERLNAQIDQLSDELGGEAGELLNQAIEGDTGGAIEGARQQVEEEAGREFQRGLRGLLGGGDEDDAPAPAQPE